MRNEWNGWVLDPDTLTLVWPGNGYYIDLDRCTASSRVLDWIIQIRKKTWTSPEVMAGLVQAFDDVLDPQATLCSSGRSLTITKERVALLVESAVTRGAPLASSVGI